MRDKRINNNKKDWRAAMENTGANPYLTFHAVKGFINEVSTRLGQPCQKC